MTTVEAGGLAAALAAFQRELPRIGKGNTAKVKSDKANYSYKYADLADVSAAVLPALGKHGLAWSTTPTVDSNGHFVLRYKLMHSSGETECGVYPLPSSTSTPQALGSAITYARRYCLCAVTGVSPDDDDDGAAAQYIRHDEYRPEDYGRVYGEGNGQALTVEQTQEPVSENPLIDWDVQISTCGTDLDKLRELWNRAPHRSEARDKITARVTALRREAAKSPPRASVEQIKETLLNAKDADEAAALMTELAPKDEAGVGVGLTETDAEVLGVVEGKYEKQPLTLLLLAEIVLKYCERHKTGPRAPHEVSAA